MDSFPKLELIWGHRHVLAIMVVPSKHAEPRVFVPLEHYLSRKAGRPWPAKDVAAFNKKYSECDLPKLKDHLRKMPEAQCLFEKDADPKMYALEDLRDFRPRAQWFEEIEEKYVKGSQASQAEYGGNVDDDEKDEKEEDEEQDEEEPEKIIPHPKKRPREQYEEIEASSSSRELDDMQETVAQDIVAVVKDMLERAWPAIGRKDLYEKLRAQMEPSIRHELEIKIREELEERLEPVIRNELEERLEPEIKAHIHQEIMANMNKLFGSDKKNKNK